MKFYTFVFIQNTYMNMIYFDILDILCGIVFIDAEHKKT